MRNVDRRRWVPGNGPRRRVLTAFRFREARLSCLISQAEAAMLLRVTLRTLQNWEAGKTRVPYAAYRLLRIMRNGELPGRQWAGWRLWGGKLYTPEGRWVEPWESSWWSLLVLQARAFRDLMARQAAERVAAGAGAARPAAALPGLVSSTTSGTLPAGTQQECGLQRMASGLKWGHNGAAFTAADGRHGASFQAQLEAPAGSARSGAAAGELSGDQPQRAVLHCPAQPRAVSGEGSRAPLTGPAPPTASEAGCDGQHRGRAGGSSSTSDQGDAQGGGEPALPVWKRPEVQAVPRPTRLARAIEVVP